MELFIILILPARGNKWEIVNPQADLTPAPAPEVLSTTYGAMTVLMGRLLLSSIH